MNAREGGRNQMAEGIFFSLPPKEFSEVRKWLLENIDATIWDAVNKFVKTSN